jgi:hypothetical protein
MIKKSANAWSRAAIPAWQVRLDRAVIAARSARISVTMCLYEFQFA